MPSNTNKLHTIRHSAEHVMHQAIKELFPKVHLAMGPSTNDGFYCDFDPNGEKVTEENFQKIEQRMRELVNLDLPITKGEVSENEARELFKDNPYKLEWISDFAKDNQKLTVYWTGNPGEKNSMVDLCRGPHVESTGKVGVIKLLSIAGAYWHGDEKNKMLTRIYGTAFPTQDELDKYLWQIEEAKKRDHRLLNKILKIYTLSDLMGPGLVSLLPNGAIIADELEEWAKDTEKKQGYVRVFTPHIASEELFKITGHVPHYLDSMYPIMDSTDKDSEEKEKYYVKPMNCAGHHLIYKSEPRSYRDLPLRIAEYGAVYRYEKSGELLGMMRVRGPIHQNDAHIFCTSEQAEVEFQQVMDLHQYYYQTLGINKNDYFLSFATRDLKNKSMYLGDDQMWDKAEKIVLRFIKKSGIPYILDEGGAAFYGPKIDFNIKTVTGKVFSASTNQLDFFIPQAFNCTYTDQDGKEKVPVCIHRAPLGAHVRFIAFLIEHYAGAFPVWLAPVQAIILPISDKSMDYANQCKSVLQSVDIRCELDERPERLQAKIRDAEMQKIPYMLIVGPKETEAESVSVRLRGERDKGSMKLGEFTKLVKEDVETKRQI